VAIVLVSLAAGASAGAADPVVMAAGDIACASRGLSTPADCSQLYTSNLLLAQRSSAEGLAAVLTLGDNQYESGTLGDFRNYFGPTWGRVSDILHPALGNHEYLTSGASGYFDYFASLGVQTGNRGEGWYSFDVGSWHLIALNSSDGCTPVSCAGGSPQELWLRNDLASTQQPCILAYWHHPLSSVSAERPIWQDLYAAGADLVLVGHTHTYRSPVARSPSGSSDPNGPREVVVGTGGKSGDIYGVLKLTLHAGSFDSAFVGSGASDSGAATCHGSPPVAKPTARFTATTSGLTATFTDASTGTPTSWRWDFGDGSTATDRNPSHPYVKAGAYTVTLTATNAGGSDTATQRVTVANPASPPQTPSEPPPATTQPATAIVPAAGPPVGAGPPRASSTAEAAASLRLSIPAPRGPLPVGVRSAAIGPRALPVRVWCPARAAGARGTRARYLPASVARALERRVGLPEGALDVATHGVEDAPARRDVRGVILVSPAAGTRAALQTGLIVDLASRGYAVVAIDHAQDSGLRQRVRDVGAVLARLSRLVPQRRASTRVAMMGGAAAAEAMRRYRTLDAGVGIDVSPRAGRGLARPFGLMVAAPAGSPGPRPILRLDVGRYGFTDFALFNAQVRLADPALGRSLEAQLQTGTLDSVAAGARAVDRERRFLARFMDRYVAVESR
jgi:hypothetical protein